MKMCKSIDEMVEEKRKEMLRLDGQVNIDCIYDEIRVISKDMVLEMLVKEVSCDMFLKMQTSDFVKMLYRIFLLREPDFEGYINNMKLLLNNSCSRLQMIDAFANLEEAKSNNIKVVGWEKEVRKQRLFDILKRVPIIGFLCRWVTNIVFLSRRMASLYFSCNMVSLRCEELEYKCNILQQQCEQLQRQHNDFGKKL